MICKRYFVILCIASCTVLFSQEALLSTEENYYNFLALDGTVERPYLNYRTLSDSVWSIPEGSVHSWSSVNLGEKRILSDSVALKMYGPQWFSSFNSAAPHGQNDGILWQGKGYNSSLTAGARLEAYGFELTLKPEIVFSQNMGFELMPSGYESEYGYIWAYFFNAGIDNPQRFGNKPFFNYSWGDSEVRYSWKTLTVGFGTQLAWIGPSKINSILHSNNAPPYPKLDIGIRPTEITLPFLDWYIGDIETRIWCGKLTESDYFDTDSTNNQNMISGLSLSYAPSFIPGLTLSANRIYLAKWEPESLKTLLSLAFFKFNQDGGGDVWDQRPGLSFDYQFYESGLNIYGEINFNDNPGPSIDAYIRNFSHTMAYSLGLVKSFDINSNKNLKGQFVFECTNLEMTPAYSQFLWSNTFYFHHQITQGHSNEGQKLGSGSVMAGNSQYFGFNVLHSKGLFGASLYRINPDNDFLFRFTTPEVRYPTDDIYGSNFKAILEYQINSKYYITPSLLIGGSFSYIPIHDILYSGDWGTSDITQNFQITFGIEKKI